jgi:hypothetical protein
VHEAPTYKKKSTQIPGASSLRQLNFVLKIDIRIAVSHNKFYYILFYTVYYILWEESWLRVIENRVLRRLFGPKRDEATGEWRKLQNEEFHDTYSSPAIVRLIKSRRMIWAGHVARMEERSIQGFVGKTEGKRPLGRPRCRWEDNNKMDLQEVGCGGMDWIGLDQDRQVAGTCECGNEHSATIKYGEFLD